MALPFLLSVHRTPLNMKTNKVLKVAFRNSGSNVGIQGVQFCNADLCLCKGWILETMRALSKIRRFRMAH